MASSTRRRRRRQRQRQQQQHHQHQPPPPPPQQQQQQTCHNLPKEVIVDILSWLPVKSLLRFRSVCRSWQDIIKSQRFLTKHLLHYYGTNGNANDRLLVHGCIPETEKLDFFMFSDQTLNNTTAREDLNLGIPIFPTSYGPCNGVICLCNGNGRLALWNPATREFRPLPKHHPPAFPSKWWAHTHAIGFGSEYSENGVGFKIVWIRNFDRLEYQFTSYTVHVAIYTTSTDTWRELSEDVFPSHHISPQLCNTYLNGTYYWWARNKFDTVLAFDMSSEVFSQIPGPAEVSGPDVPWHFGSGSLVIYEDSVALIHVRYGESTPNESIGLWVMEVETHLWTKKWAIGPFLEVEHITGLWKNGHIIMETSTHNLVMCDPYTGETKDLGCFEDGGLGSVETLVYRDSLVSTMGQNGDGLRLQVVQDPDFFEIPAPKYIIYDDLNGSGRLDDPNCLQVLCIARQMCRYYWAKVFGSRHSESLHDD